MYLVRNYPSLCISYKTLCIIPSNFFSTTIDKYIGFSIMYTFFTFCLFVVSVNDFSTRKFCSSQKIRRVFNYESNIWKRIWSKFASNVFLFILSLCRDKNQITLCNQPFQLSTNISNKPIVSIAIWFYLLVLRINVHYWNFVSIDNDVIFLKYKIHRALSVFSQYNY